MRSHRAREDIVGDADTVNGYRYILSEWLWPNLEGMDVQNCWFQQNGTTCHTSRDTLTIARTIPKRVISLCGDHERFTRSCEFMPCDLFLWGFFKSNVYADKPQTI